MNHFKLGFITDSFRLPWREALGMARALGARGCQVHAVGDEVSPGKMDGSARREFRSMLAKNVLELSALCGDLGGHGFTIESENPARIEQSKRIVDLAVDLGTEVVTTHIGVIPKDPGTPRFQTLLAACRDLATYAAKKKVTFAIETGPEPAEVLARFLTKVGESGLGVNLDPANLVMVLGEDPAQAVKTLAPWIVHTHAKDGVHLAPCDAEEVYDAFARGGVAGFEFGKYFNETPLGQGQVPWDRYLEALRGAGYRGYLTIEREVGEDPASDIQLAADFLRSKGAVL